VRGVVKSGPRTADGFTWYEVAYENGVVGWAVDRYHDDAAVEFLHEQRVATTADLVVHDDYALSAPGVWTAPEGSAGYVRAGPQVADGYTWWQVAFNSDVTGWCVDAYLDAALVDGYGVGYDGAAGEAFADGDTVHATTTLNTRKQPGVDQPLVATVDADATAEVVNGPTDADGYTWWGLRWLDADVWGWSVETYLEAGNGGT